MKFILNIFLLFVVTISFGQKTNDIDYKHILCDNNSEQNGVIWKTCDYYVERFDNPDTINLYRQVNRENLIGVEKCGRNSKCWRFFNQKQFKESFSSDKDDTESKLAKYNVIFDKKSKKYTLTIKYKSDIKNKTYIKYSYYIYKTFQDSANTTTKITLVKNTSR